jgi:hypothetical protein
LVPLQIFNQIWNRSFGHSGMISDHRPILEILISWFFWAYTVSKYAQNVVNTDFCLVPGNIGPIWNRPFGHSGMISDLRPILENLISWFFWVYTMSKYVRIIVFTNFQLVPAPPQNISPIWNRPFGHSGTISDFWPIFKIF